MSSRSYFGRSERNRAISATVHRHGSPERIGFRRGDDRHPKHPAHLSRFHVNGICDCIGRVQRRDIPQRLGVEA